MSNAVLKIASLQNERWQEPLKCWFISMKFYLLLLVSILMFSAEFSYLMKCKSIEFVHSEASA